MDALMRVDISLGTFIAFIIYGGLFSFLRELFKFALVLGLTFYIAMGIFELGNELGLENIGTAGGVPRLTATSELGQAREYPLIVEIPKEREASVKEIPDISKTGIEVSKIELPSSNMEFRNSSEPKTLSEDSRMPGDPEPQKSNEPTKSSEEFEKSGDVEPRKSNEPKTSSEESRIPGDPEIDRQT